VVSQIVTRHLSVVTALDARPDDELTLEYVKGKLVDEYRRRSDSSTSDNLESALKTHGKTKFKGKAAGSSSKPRETRECHYCKKPGHLKSDCRILKAKLSELEKVNSSQKARIAVSDAESDSKTHVAFTLNVDKLSSNGWYIDSGATSHMINDRSFFTEFVQLQVM